jgi:hypothetical protein
VGFAIFGRFLAFLEGDLRNSSQEYVPEFAELDGDLLVEKSGYKWLEGQNC